MAARLLVALIVLALWSVGGAVVAESVAPAPHAVDLQADARLRVPVRVTSEGSLLRRVIQGLGSATGVPLRAEGRAGDERIIAFAQDRPAAEVLRAVAELYRLEWHSEGRGYVLRKLPTAAREEAAARTKGLREAMEPVRARFRRAETATSGGITRVRLADGEAISFGTGAPELFRTLHPIIEPALPRLFSAGYLYQPVSTLPLSTRNSLVPRLQTWLNGEDRAHTALSLWDRDRYHRGTPLRIQETPRAESCTLLVELERGQPFGISIGMSAPGREQVEWFNESLKRLDDEGARLYSVAGPSTDKAPEALTRLVRLEPTSEEVDPWLAALRTVAKSTGVPVYSDWYTHVKSVGGRRRTAVAGVQGALPAGVLLDRLCGMNPAQPGLTPAPGHSFWWRCGSAVLVRSGTWIWDAETVLPATLTEGIARSVRATGRLSPTDLSGLAALSAPQVYGIQTSPNRLDGWRAGIVIPASFGISTKRELFTGGLAWTTLSTPDRQQLLRALRPDERAAAERYAASVEVARSVGSDDGTPTVELEIDGRLGKRTVFASVEIPLPDFNGPGPEVLRTPE